MCNRTQQLQLWEEIEEWTGIGPAEGVAAVARKPDVRPTDPLAILCRRPDTGARAGVQARWGLIPAWHKGSAKEFKATTFNARSERLHEGLWRSYLKNRCIIPVTAYYEWRDEGGPKKQKYRVSPTTNDPGLLFAGLWSKVDLPDYSGLTCTIITEEAEGRMNELHGRMPVMIPASGIDAWLEGAELATLPRLGVENLQWHPA